jgi:uncharacterized membrane protein YagU involved in acid resistance
MTEEKEAINPDPHSLRDRGSPAARLVAGIAAGIVGGSLMIGFLMAYASLTGAGLTMPLKAIGAAVYGVEALVAGPVALLTGASIQLGFTIVLGMLFALCVSRRTSIVSALFAGTAIGIAVWLLMDLLVLPLANPTMAARVALIPLAYFVAHVLYGLGLSTAPIFMRTFTRERGYHRTVRHEEAHAI